MSVSCKWGLTFILGSALLNFGTRAVNLGRGLRHLHDKNKVNLFQRWFRAGTPEQGKALLKYWATGHFYSCSLGLHIKFLRKVTRTYRSAKYQHNFSPVVQNIKVEEEKKWRIHEYAGHFLGGPGPPPEVVQDRPMFSDCVPEKLHLHGKKSGRLCQKWRPAWPFLEAPLAKWMSC